MVWPFSCVLPRFQHIGHPALRNCHLLMLYKKLKNKREVLWIAIYMSHEVSYRLNPLIMNLFPTTIVLWIAVDAILRGVSAESGKS